MKTIATLIFVTSFLPLSPCKAQNVVTCPVHGTTNHCNGKCVPAAPEDKAPLKKGQFETDGQFVLRAGQDFHNTPYGKDGLVCTSFMEKSLLAAGYKIDGQARGLLHVNDVDVDGDKKVSKEEFEAATANNKVGGVAQALVHSGQGVAVTKFNDLQQGDVVQYWDQKADGSYEGHQGIIAANMRDGDVALYGAHRTIGRVGTIHINLATKVSALAARPTAPK